MRKQSFLSIGIIMLFFSACTKQDLRNPTTQIETNPQASYSFSYSKWITNADLSWFDGATSDPSRQSDITTLELSQEMLDGGSIVLIYAKSSVDGSVKAMPAEYFEATSNETNTYSASHVAGAITLSHTKTVNGSFEVPADLDDISFRYIIVNPTTPDPNARQITIDNLLSMSYKDVTAMLGIPE